MAGCRIRGLLCRLFIPQDWETFPWSAFLGSLLPHAQGLVIDPPYWDPMRRGPYLQPMDLKVIQKILGLLPADRPLLVRITGKDRRKTASHLQHLDEALRPTAHYGQVVWLDTPLMYHSNRGLPDLLLQLATLTQRPFALENDPDRVRPFKSWSSHVNLRTHVLKQLAHNPRLSALIHHGSLRRSLNYAKAVVKRRDFCLLDGDEANFLDYPNTTGVVSASANVLAPLWAALLARKSLSGRAEHMTAYMETMSILQEGLRLLRPHPTAALAEMLHAMGYSTTRPALDEEDRKQMHRFLNRLPDVCIHNY
ncbi:Dihydrodipicolinate synthase/N-acetylneuraminate lyase [Desulfacinum hydrothermale DSM 13146]|uniref:Dihydrodipicolinate synthase/N-acetylneuraminate lyase n=1 Tax=Desulfacinum hydrothermale DSM 13146 TaxID=1121390 RepID=A0A1W1XMN7_9BACT|nr:hypothetical protein [Desulfacinum hydrothermale]SMC25186.1 Dihydrodipicolinate synthase/N-acetylneuraminate lyase [Desulfacinum hydrothermale DSM 13146]